MYHLLLILSAIFTIVAIMYHLKAKKQFSKSELNKAYRTGLKAIGGWAVAYAALCLYLIFM